MTIFGLNIFFLNLVLVLGDGTPWTLPTPSSGSFRVTVKVSDGRVSLDNVWQVIELRCYQVSHSVVEPTEIGRVPLLEGVENNQCSWHASCSRRTIPSFKRSVAWTGHLLLLHNSIVLSTPRIFAFWLKNALRFLYCLELKLQYIFRSSPLMADSPSCCSLPSPAKIFQYAISCDSGHQQFWKSISKQHQEGHQAHSLWQTVTRSPWDSSTSSWSQCPWCTPPCWGGSWGDPQ